MSSIKNIPNDNSKKEEKEKKNFNVNKNGSDRIFTPFEEPMVSLFEANLKQRSKSIGHVLTTN